MMSAFNIALNRFKLVSLKRKNAHTEWRSKESDLISSTKYIYIQTLNWHLKITPNR